MEPVRITRWNGVEAPSAQEFRRVMERENLSPYAWSNAPGDEYSLHAHDYNKVIYITSGSIVWILPSTGQEIETHAGDRLDLPRGVVHAARVGPHGVACLEAHL